VFATFWALSCAARRRMAVLGPPGGVGELGRPVARLSEPETTPALAGEAARGEEDCLCQFAAVEERESTAWSGRTIADLFGLRRIGRDRWILRTKECSIASGKGRVVVGR